MSSEQLRIAILVKKIATLALDFIDICLYKNGVASCNFFIKQNIATACNIEEKLV